MGKRARIGLASLLFAIDVAVAATTERVSVGLGGLEWAFLSGYPLTMSPDGRFVLFASRPALGAPDGFPGGSPYGAFLRDRVAGTTTQVSLNTPTAATPDMRFLVFVGGNVLLVDRTTGVSEQVDVSFDGGPPFDTGTDGGAAISADARYVAFVSYARNLVPGDDNHDADIFVRDRMAGVTERVNEAPDGSDANGRSLFPVITPDGRHVAYQSRARNLIAGGTSNAWHVFVHDRDRRTIDLASILPDGSAPGSETCCWGIEITPDGRHVAFVNSSAYEPVTGVSYRAYVRDRVAGTTELVSLTKDGAPSTGLVSGMALSADGRFVAFGSNSSDIVPADTNFGSGNGEYGGDDIFLRDRLLGTTERVSLASDGSQSRPGRSSFLPKLSADARVVAFLSDADNLVPGDANRQLDVFVRDRGCGNGVVEGIERCDDGDDVAGDGCDANCSPTGCGNGQITAGEACDAGAANGSDGCCQADCVLVDADADGVCDAADRCLGATIAGTVISLGGLTTGSGNDRLLFKGLGVVPRDPPVNPSVNGIRILVGDSARVAVVDVTIPGGSGWTVRGRGWQWAGTSPILGRAKVTVTDRSGTHPGLLQFTVKTRGGSFGAGPLASPVTGLISLFPSDAGSMQCAEARAACIARDEGNGLTCR